MNTILRGEMMSKKVRVHKKINLLPIHMGKESLVNIFYGLMEEYNKQVEYQALTISKQNLWNLGGFKQRYNEEAFMDVLKILTKPTTFQNKKVKVWGSIFTIEEIEGNEVKIYVSEPYRPYLFYKKDIDLMTKAKKKESMSIQDLDYWDREGKTKSKYLVLLHKADLLGISGKYNKRLYALLMQFNKSLKFFTTWENFKEVLEIPKSYTSAHIDQQIFKKAKKELLKFGVKITKINKMKKGRSIDKVEILFKVEMEQKIEKHIKIQKKEIVVNPVLELKNKTIRDLGKTNKLNLIEKLEKIETLKEIEAFRTKYEL